MKGRQKFTETLWRFTYPLSNGEVQNPAIRRFQTGILTLQEANPERVLRDFVEGRGYTIEGKAYDKDTTVDALQHDLAAFVDKSTAYPPEDYPLIVKYLLTRGGQDHNFLVQYLIRDNHFTDSQYRAESSVFQKLIDANWEVNKKGQIEFSYCTDLTTLDVITPENPNIQYLVFGENNKKLSCYDQTSEEFHARRSAGLPPLLRLSIKIHLDVRDGMIIPIVNSIVVDGFNRAIRVHKENFVNLDDRQSFMFTQILDRLDSQILFFKNDHEIQRQMLIIKHLIEESNYGQNMGPVKLACQYIVRIHCKIKKFIGSDEYLSIADMLNKDSEFMGSHHQWFGTTLLDTLTNEDISQDLLRYGINALGQVSNKEYKKEVVAFGFGSTYLDLQTALHQYAPLMTEQYSSSKIFDAFINQCTSNQTETVNVFNEFRHGYRIGDAVVNLRSDDADIHHAIDDVAKKATSDKQDQKALARWVSSRGNQQLDKLVEMFINSDEIDISTSSPVLSKGGLPHLTVLYDRASPSWEIDSRGLLSLTCIYYVTALSCDDLHMVMIKNPHNNQLQLIHEGDNEYPAQQSPIMRIETKLSLTVKEGQVTPVCSNLRVDSYSRDVTPVKLDMKPAQSFTK